MSAMGDSFLKGQEYGGNVLLSPRAASKAVALSQNSGDDGCGKNSIALRSSSSSSGGSSGRSRDRRHRQSHLIAVLSHQ